ncbi:MAG: non-homologous end-joining DNA ligase [Methanothrix sp.]|uniref:non-homologous end-joining DNA ligase n=1 Tax=Methanothrix sp. TaxID=90426 RepID=UPI003BB7260C
MNPIKPMLAVSGQPFNREGWIFEPKIDGTRCIASAKKRVLLSNRRLADITYRYPELASALASLQGECVLDGEITVFRKGIPSFRSLAERDHQNDPIKIDYLSRAMPASYVVFDILSLDGESLIHLPLKERKRILFRELEAELKDSETLTLIDSFPEKGEDYFQAALKMGIEGVVGKRLESLYLPGIRSQDWVKIKKSLKLDLVVGGYIPGKGDRLPYFGGLLLGAHSQGKLVYISRVGSGFTEEELQDITSRFSPTEKPPFTNPPATAGVVWIEPKMVVQVTALERTHDGGLRAPVFLRMRDDKEPEECTLDQLG